MYLKITKVNCPKCNEVAERVYVSLGYYVGWNCKCGFKKKITLQEKKLIKQNLDKSLKLC